jgi:hypothetical protein
MKRSLSFKTHTAMLNSISPSHPLPAWLLAGILTVALGACDTPSIVESSTPDPGKATIIQTERISPVDGRPIVRMTEQVFRDSYMEEVRAYLTQAGIPLLQHLKTQVAAKAEEGHELYLGEVLRSMPTAAKDANRPSTHLELMRENEQVTEAFLTLEVLGSFGPQPVGVDCDELLSANTCITAYIADPDDETDIGDTGTTTVYAPSVEDASVLVSILVGEPGIVQVTPVTSTVIGIGVDNQESSIDGSAGPLGVTDDTEDRLLALSQLRTQDNRESGDAELVMSIQQTDDYNQSYTNRWNYFFDKRSTANISWTHLASFISGILDGGELDSLMTILAKAVQFGSTRRVQGADGAVYEVPDVNADGISYSFTAMSSWGLLGKAAGAKADYFPIVLLGEQPYRLVLQEKDNTWPWSDYKYYSRRKSTAVTESVNTYDFSTGQYKTEATKFTSKSHSWGSSDDVVLQSGARKATKPNVFALMGNTYDGTITAATGNHQYVFRTVKNRVVVSG